MAKEFTHSQPFTRTRSEILSRLKRPLTSLVLSLGLVLAGASHLQVQAVNLLSPTLPQAAKTADFTTAKTISHTSNKQVVPAALSSESNPNDGIYLYGQSPEPNQPGYAYAVMEIVDNQAVGAFYMPHSVFDCFYGEVQPDQLALNVMPSYGQPAYDFSLSRSPSTVATLAPNHQPPMQLSGYHALETVSDNDHRILDMCRSVVQNVR